MNLKEIRELLDLLIEREIEEFEMERGNLKVRIKRGLDTRPAPLGVREGVEGSGSARGLPAISPRPVAAPPAEPGLAPREPSEPAGEEIFIVKSPMVGTFYASPQPNAPPFVNLGDVAEVGQVLCIVEAMKLMNEIESEIAGEILRIYVENAQPVEYGQSLFAIKPSHKKL